jgi:hypothetical protein
MLFDESDPAAREAQRTSPVAKAKPSPAAQRKAARKRTNPADGEPLPVHSFHTLLGDLATLTRNVVRLGRDRLTAILATPTRTQHRALNALRSKEGKVRSKGCLLKAILGRWGACK